MNNFKNYLKESSIEPAKLSSGNYSIGDKFRLMTKIAGTNYDKDHVFTIVESSEESLPIKLGGIGEYSFFDENNIKINLHAGPQIIDKLFEHIPPPPVEEQPPSVQIIRETIIQPTVIEKIIEKVIVEKPVRGPMGPVGPQGEKGDTVFLINIDGGSPDEVYGGTVPIDGGWI
jgi:hypothetical protein